MSQEFLLADCHPLFKNFWALFSDLTDPARSSEVLPANQR